MSPSTAGSTRTDTFPAAATTMTALRAQPPVCRAAVARSAQVHKPCPQPWVSLLWALSQEERVPWHGHCSRGCQAGQPAAGWFPLCPSSPSFVKPQRALPSGQHTGRTLPWGCRASQCLPWGWAAWDLLRGLASDFDDGCHPPHSARLAPMPTQHPLHSGSPSPAWPSALAQTYG